MNDGYQSKNYGRPTKRYVQTMSLKDNPELIARYREAHDKAHFWREIGEGIREVGILEMEIYIVGCRLVMIVDAPLDFDWDKAMSRLAGLPRQAEWEDHVAGFQECARGATSNEKWQMMERMFHIYEDERPKAKVERPKAEKGYEENSVAVDASCSGNPGQMEYRGVYVATGQVLFRFGPVYGTNNIGEFLAIVHALALLKQKHLDLPVYSDSVNAMKWVAARRCRTKLPQDERTRDLFNLIHRAEEWLRHNEYDTRILKWDTRKWGEIPADYGRKK